MKSEFPAAPGGLLKDLAEYHKRANQPYYLSSDETQLWNLGARGELIRKPIDCTAPVSQSESREILRVPGTRVVTHLIEPSETHPPNCVLYMIRPPYDMDSISRNARKVVRRGLRNFENRRCTWEELEQHGYEAWAETDDRHGFAVGSREKFLADVKGWQSGRQFYDIWGAWAGDDLAGWVLIRKYDNSAAFVLVTSKTAYLSKAPNNVLHYLPTHFMLNEEKRRCVSTGFSSIQPGAEMGLHDFKVRLGFKPIPVHRTHIVHPVLRPLFSSGLASWMWEKTAEIFPQYSSLRKIAGMSRMMSGRQKDPLSWVPEA